MMTADVFLAAFVGCLFALAIVAIAAFQIGRRKFQALLREQGATIAALQRVGANEMAAAQEVNYATVRCQCGREQAIYTYDSNEKIREFLGSIGWKNMERGSWECPFCVNSGPERSMTGAEIEKPVKCDLR